MSVTGRRMGLIALFIWLLGGSSQAQNPQALEVPPLLQSQPNFYGAIAGGDLELSWRAEPLQLDQDAEVTLTLTVRRVRNAEAVRRPDLSTQEAFRERFQVTNLADPPAQQGTQSLQFRYRLRPRSTGQIEIPSLTFAYFNPARREGPLPEKILDPIPLTVRSRAAQPDDVPRAISYPETFFLTPELAQSPFPIEPPDWRHWVACLVVFVVLTAGWVGFWYWKHPEGARRARIRQIRSVKRALDAIDHLPTDDPIAELSRVLLRYLKERHGISVTSPMPREVEAACKRKPRSEEKVQQAVELFESFDCARYSPQGETLEAVVQQARNLILSWEEI